MKTRDIAFILAPVVAAAVAVLVVVIIMPSPKPPPPMTPIPPPASISEGRPEPAVSGCATAASAPKRDRGDALEREYRRNLAREGLTPFTGHREIAR